MDKIDEELMDSINRMLAEPVVDAMMDAVGSLNDDMEMLEHLVEHNSEIVSVYAMSVGISMRYRGKSDAEIRKTLGSIVTNGGYADRALKERLAEIKKERIGSEDEYRIVDDEE